MNPGQTAPLGCIPERIFEKVNFEKKIAGCLQKFVKSSFHAKI